MRRIVLILALTALLVAVALAGSAWGQPLPPQESCEGLVQAVTAQDEEAIPKKAKQDKHPGQGDEHSAAREVASEHRCPSFGPAPPGPPGFGQPR
jgi:hypothetical protein